MRWWLAADLWADWGLVHTGIVGSAGLLGAEQFLDAVGQRRRDDAVRVAQRAHGGPHAYQAGVQRRAGRTRFEVALHEHPEIIAMMESRWKTELNAARRRMARVPEGGSLVKNPVQGPPGFQIGNVFVLAGVPSIMRGMLEDVGPRLRGGAVTVSRTVRVEGSGESVIAAPLEAVAKAHPDMSLGSYPFFDGSVYGSNLVLRGRDAGELGVTVAELIAALQAEGVASVREIDAAA